MFLTILIGLSLALTPGAASAAPSMDCSMPGAESGMAPDHDKMPCCTPECVAPAAAAVIPDQDVERNSSSRAGAPGLLPAANALSSVNPAAADPPPRLNIA